MFRQVNGRLYRIRKRFTFASSVISNYSLSSSDLAGGERKNLLREWRREVSA